MTRYEQQMDEMDASVFSGEILYTDLESFRKYLARWNRALEEHDKALKEEKEKDREEESIAGMMLRHAEELRNSK